MTLTVLAPQACDSGTDHGQHLWTGHDGQERTCHGHYRGFDLPHPEVIKADPSTCPHAVLDEMSGVPWGFEDCVTCGKRFSMRGDDDA